MFQGALKPLREVQGCVLQALQPPTIRRDAAVCSACMLCGRTNSLIRIASMRIPVEVPLRLLGVLTRLVCCSHQLLDVEHAGTTPRRFLWPAQDPHWSRLEWLM